MSEPKTIPTTEIAINSIESHGENQLSNISQTLQPMEVAGEQLSDIQPRENDLQKNNIIPLNIIHDIPVTVSAVLGKKKIDVASLVNMEKGAIIDIDRKVGEPVDLYVNDTLVARGELILVDGNLGVSMTEIIHNSNSQFPDHSDQ